MQKLIDNFLKDVGKGHEWSGLVATSNWKLISTYFPYLYFGLGATVNMTQSRVRWSTGEDLLFMNFDKPGDYYHVHGYQFQWIGIYGTLPYDWDKFPAILKASTSIVAPRMIRET